MSKTTKFDIGPQDDISQSEEEIIYTALGSQVRRDILSFIYQYQIVGFNELKKKFRDLKVGSLYHQLNTMKALIEQDENKKYYLSDLGKVAHNLMILNRDHIETSNVRIDTHQEKKKTFSTKILDFLTAFFLPRKIFQYLTSESLRTFFEGLIVIGAMLFFTIDSKIVLAGFFPLEIEEWYFSLIGVLGLWIFLGLVTELLSTMFYKRKYNPLKLLAVIPFTLIPSMIALFFIWLQTKVSTTFLFLNGQILIILGQIWTLPLMTTAVSQSKELAISRSSLPVLFTFYLAYGITFVIFGITS